MQHSEARPLRSTGQDDRSQVLLSISVPETPLPIEDETFVKVHLIDSDGRGIPGRRVAISSSFGRMRPTVAVTNGEGAVEAILDMSSSLPVPGTIDVAAQTGQLSVTQRLQVSREILRVADVGLSSDISENSSVLSSVPRQIDIAACLSSPGMRIKAAGGSVISAMVRTIWGAPIEGETVHFSGPEGSRLTPSSAVTDADGRATVTIDLRTAWATPGSVVQVSAKVETISVQASLTVLGSNLTGYVPRYGSTVTDSPSFGQSELVFPSPVVHISRDGEFCLAVLENGETWTTSAGQFASDGDGSSLSASGWSPLSGIVGAATSAIGIGGSRYLLLKDGTVVAWGSNDHGQLGDGTIEPFRQTPKSVAGLTDVIQIAAAERTAYALRADGSVWAWGFNRNGEIGNGTRMDSSLPVPVARLTSGISHIAAGGSVAYALREGDGVYAWGDGSWGALGDGREWHYRTDPFGNARQYWPPALTPVVVDMLPRDIVALTAGRFAGYALAQDGTVWAWGRSVGPHSSQFWGSGGFSVSASVGDSLRSAVKVANIRGAVAISSFSPRMADEAGGAYALMADGSVRVIVCTETSGVSAENHLPKYAFEAFSGPRVPAEAVSNTESRVVCEQGLILRRTNEQRAVLHLSGARAFSGEKNVVEVILTGPRDRSGTSRLVNLEVEQLGSPASPRRLQSTTNIMGIASFTVPMTDRWIRPGSVFALTGEAYGQIVQREVPARGSNLHSLVAGEILFAPQDGYTFPAPVVATASGTYQRDTFFIALLEDGSVWSRGANGNGQLGDGTTTSRKHEWAPVAGLQAGVTEVAAGANTAYAVMEDGSVMMWGSAKYVGVRTIHGPDVLIPTIMSSLRPGIVSVVSAAHTAFAIQNDGADGLQSDKTIWAWGKNDVGQAGVDCEDAVVYLPQEVYLRPPGKRAAVNAVRTLFAGRNTAYALTYSGYLFAWGANDRGQVGDGTTVNRRTPVFLSSPLCVEQGTAGGDAAYVLLQDGDLYAWGDNSRRQLRAPTDVPYMTTAVKVSDVKELRRIAAFGDLLLGQDHDGNVVGWGAEHDPEEPQDLAVVTLQNSTRVQSLGGSSSTSDTGFLIG